MKIKSERHRQTETWHERWFEYSPLSGCAFRRIKMLIENSGAEVEETEMERVVGYSQGKELTEKIRSYPPNIVNQLKSLLPTQSGFFFGGTEYDEYYIQNIYDTIEILEKMLAETNFDTHIITYHSSW